MKSNTVTHTERNHAGLFGRVAHEVSAFLEWLAGPAMSERRRKERVMAEVRRLKYDTSALHLQ